MKKKVLVVESDPAVARLEQRILSAMHEVVLVAKNTPVIEAIQLHRPDLVILDHVEACEPIRQQRRDILIVVLLDRVFDSCSFGWSIIDYPYLCNRILTGRHE